MDVPCTSIWPIVVGFQIDPDGIFRQILAPTNEGKVNPESGVEAKQQNVNADERGGGPNQEHFDGRPDGPQHQPPADAEPQPRRGGGIGDREHDLDECRLQWLGRNLLNKHFGTIAITATDTAAPRMRVGKISEMTTHVTGARVMA